MQEIQLWAVESDDKGDWTTVSVEKIESTETEEKLEDILVRSPGLLMNQLVLVGRQVQTDGGPLDLIGIDEDGRVVILELKRGTLTRDAVSQIIDYTSDIAEMDGNQFGKLIEDQSGRDGIEKINDFGDWYNQNYPDNESALDEKSRMVLVGLGVDNRTRRMVNFLTDSGVDIQLLTFHAFEKDGQIFIARQIEIMSPTGRGTGRRGSHRSTRETNLQTLQKEAASLGAEIFLDEVAGFLNDLLPAYQWPGTTSYSYSLTERTDQGRASLRVYVALRLNYKEPGALHIVLPERAIEAAGSQLKTFREKFNKEIRYDGRYKDMHIQITGQNWSSIKSELEPVLTDMVAGWKAKTRAEDQIHGSEGVQTIE